MFGDVIKKLRTAHNLNQVQLAGKLNISKQTVSNWENNNILPSIEMLVKIAQFFMVSTDYLLKDEIVEENEKIPKAEEEYQPPGSAQYICGGSKYLHGSGAEAFRLYGGGMCAFSPVSGASFGVGRSG